IRDFHVTGVQTCALPICIRCSGCTRSRPDTRSRQAGSVHEIARWRDVSEVPLDLDLLFVFDDHPCGGGQCASAVCGPHTRLGALQPDTSGVRALLGGRLLVLEVEVVDSDKVGRCGLDEEWWEGAEAFPGFGVVGVVVPSALQVVSERGDGLVELWGRIPTRFQVGRFATTEQVEPCTYWHTVDLLDDADL